MQTLSAGESPPPTGPIQAALLNVGEPERYRILAGLLSDLADATADSARGRDSHLTEQLKAALREKQEIERQKAELDDQLRAQAADFEHRQRQLEAEQTRSRDLQSVVESQRARLDTTQKEFRDVDTQLVARNSEMHKLQVERDDLYVRLSRAEAKTRDTSGLDNLEDQKRKLAGQIQALQAEMSQLQQDKNSEIEDLKDKLRASGTERTQSADRLLYDLWDELARAKLAPGGIQPTPEAAKRLVGTLVELAQFVDRVETDLSPFLSDYTKHHAAMSRHWQAFAGRGGLLKFVQQTLAPVSGPGPGALRLSLAAFQRFVFAMVVGGHSVMECIKPELVAYLKGEHGSRGDRDYTVAEFIKSMGCDYFAQDMIQLRSKNMAKAFGAE